MYKLLQLLYAQLLEIFGYFIFRHLVTLMPKYYASCNMWSQSLFLTIGQFPASFSLFLSFQYSWQYIGNIKFCRWLDLNHGPLVPEHTALSTDPQPLLRSVGRLVKYQLDFEHRYATPWAVSSSLGDVKLFFGPKHNIYALFMILFDLFDSILLFACQICHVNCEAENWK